MNAVWEHIHCKERTRQLAVSATLKADGFFGKTELTRP